MGFQIEDGGGTGRTVTVSESGKLHVAAVTSTKEHYANHNQGRAYNVLFTQTPSANGCFLYVKNTDDNLALSIEGIWLKMEADDYMDVKLGVTGTPSNSSSITPVNMNTSSGLIAQGKFEQGSNITGISGGSTCHRIFHSNSKGSVYWNFNMDIVLGTNGVFTLYAGTTETLMSGTLVFNYHGINN